MRASHSLPAAFVAGLVLAGCADRTPTATEPAAGKRALAPAALAGTRGHAGTSVVTSGVVPAAVGGFAVLPLGRGRFPDDVSMTFKLKQGRGTTVAHVQDPSNVLVARLTFQPGGSVGWHTHHGPVIVTVASGALTLVDGDDCTQRVYPAGTAFVDPGQGHLHLAFNGTADETVLYATFLDVPAGQPATIPAASPGCAR